MSAAWETAILATMRRAIKREATARIARGEVLLDGEWIASAEVKQRQRKAQLRAMGRLIESLALQVVVALIGVGLMLSTLLLL